MTFKAKPPSVGRMIFKVKLLSVGRMIFKVKPPSVGQCEHQLRMRGICTLLLGAKGTMLSVDCCGRLVTEREGEELLSLLRVEAAQLRGVPWVLLVHPCFGVA
jgi:hypothetical protein